MKKKLVSLLLAFCVALTITAISGCEKSPSDNSTSIDSSISNNSTDSSSGSTSNDTGGDSSTDNNPPSNDNSSSDAVESTVADNGLVFVRNDKGYVVGGYFGNAKNLEIPAQYNNQPVLEIAPRAFYGCISLESVTIPEGITHIGQNAFADCYRLTNVSLPTSITEIGDYAFETNAAQEENGLYYVGNWVVYSNRDITQIIFRSGTVGIAASALRSLQEVTDVTVPESVKFIGGYAFSGCSKLETVVLPNGLRSLGREAFNECESLRYTVDNDEVSYLGNEQNPNLVLMKANNDRIFEYILPNDTRFIYSEAFRDCDYLTQITFPDTLLGIGWGAFDGCEDLEKVYIPSVQAWCNIAFDQYATDSLETSPLYYAGNLYVNGVLATEIAIPSGMTEIQPYAFYGCTSVGKVILPDTVRYIGNHAFYKCTNLTEINFPESITHFGNAAFVWTSLQEITLPDNVQWVRNVFSVDEDFTYNTYDTGLYIGSTENPYLLLVNTESGSLWGASSCVIHEDTKVIDGAFQYNVNLTEIVIPDSVEVIGENTFAVCEYLTDVTIGKGVTEIGVCAFYQCSSLESITLPEEVEYIEEGAFYECAGLKTLTLPSSLRYLGSQAIEGCTELTDIYYLGTEAEWNALPKQEAGNWSDWNGTLNTFTVHCTDKDIPYFTQDGGDNGDFGEGGDTQLPDDGTTCWEHDWGEWQEATEQYGYGAAYEALGSLVQYCNNCEEHRAIVGSEAKYISNFCKFLGEEVTVSDYSLELKTSENTYIPITDFTIKDATLSVTGWQDVILCYNGAEIKVPTRAIVDNVENASSEFDYYYDFEDGSIVLTRYYGENPYVFLPAHFNRTPITKISRSAFAEKDMYTVVLIGKVTKIDARFITFEPREEAEGVYYFAVKQYEAGTTNFERIYTTATEEDWASIEITDSFASPYYYSEEKPQQIGNYWYFDEKGNMRVWDILENSFVAMKSNLLFRDTSLGSRGQSMATNFLLELEDREDVGFVTAIAIWETTHVIAEPAYIFDTDKGLISHRAIYLLTLYDILGASAMKDNAMDWMSNANTVFATDILDKILEKGKEIDLNKLEEYLDKTSVDELEKAIQKVSSVEWVDSFKYFASAYDGAYEAFTTFLRYHQLRQLGVSYTNVLDKIANDTNNPLDLRVAAEECKAYIQAACNMTPVDFFLSATTLSSVSAIFDYMEDKVWDKIIECIPGLAYVNLAAKGFQAVCVPLNMDGITQKYYELKSIVGIEKALHSIITATPIDYYRRENAKEAENYVAAMGMYQETLLKGYDYSISMLEEYCKSLVASDAEKTEATGVITNIKELKQEVQNSYVELADTLNEWYEGYYTGEKI